MDNKQLHILIIEDDKKLAALTKEYLESKGGYRVSLESRGDRAVKRVVQGDFQLVILDIMLPGVDGLTICKTLRPHYAGPILMLTALDDEVDQIVGLEVGADDYLAKPASPRLLLARIKSLLRRATELNANLRPPVAEPQPRDDAERITLGSLVIDPVCRAVFMGGRELDISTAEFDLLWYLARRRGKVASREDIFRDLRGIEWDGLDRSVDQRVKRLRQKLGDDAQNPKWIKSVRGTGYLFVAPNVNGSGTP